MQDGDERTINHAMAVGLFGGMIRTIAYHPAVVAGFMDRAEDLTEGKTPPSAKDDYEAVAEMFIQIISRNHQKPEDPVRVGDFINRVGDLLNVEVVEKLQGDPSSCRTLDNIPVSVN